ncbi:bifunctional molybdenum cofactor biosynthesis protein MoaC/MoaB [Chryseobacterium wangxinyae]|uniref:bifunctional molybdenum cofactor biosynthesis protein MoaC/MoaB n=1 Tax=Chryseobacterium sp. CY350 TaxID=2997336 RepID=UPI00226FA5FB|nr:bifunctional molybdenum cofactor biosynthesis protein MoaC/MoaB [Chryseobacterium sp. CY350]MCY0977342.1 bifunctional molybdenum cofactor biosynthesis protein MoaC/MoaB [Chryseobacterium sp. CY350]WBZ95639.1 bifunctional molybdenum cofactor biosynthesis protein MoaC/MoaB [Chryseobacterium sp. CY350]
MVDITHKSFTLRKAIATATVKTSSEKTISAIENRTVPKGDIFEFSRASALFAVKKTSDVIPDCHPLPVEYTSVTFKIKNLSVIISVEVHTIYKTGVEVEAMHGASVAALVMYDMLKPIDKKVEIENIRLVEKQGGKTDLNKFLNNELKVAVVVCSDSVSKGLKEDSSGKAICDALEKYQISNVDYQVIPDDFDTIQKTLKKLKDNDHDLVIFTGGTGLSSRDQTPDAVSPMIDRPIPGIMETARNYGQQRIKTAMLSRGVAGFSGHTLVITLPGSKKAVEESMEALFPQILHVFQLNDNKIH